MSTTAKTGIALVLILVLLIIGWFFVSSKSPEEIPANNTALQTEISTPTPTPKLPNTAGTGMSELSDLSDDALGTDIEAVGKQINELSSDNMSIDQVMKEAI